MLKLYPNSLHQMESAICLRHCPFPHGFKEFQGARPNRLHLRATLLGALQFSVTRHPVTRSVMPVNCTLERFSKPFQNEGSGNKILRGVTGVSLVLACVLGLFNFSGKINPKLTTAYAFSSNYEDMVNQAPGRFAVKSLLEIKRDADLNEIPSKFMDLGPDENQVKILKSVAIGHTNSKKRDEALKLLEEQYNKCKDKSTEAEKYLALALVEVSMFQEKFGDARARLDEQIDKLLDEKIDKPRTSKIGQPFQMNSKKKGVELTPKQKCRYLWVSYISDDTNQFDKLKIAQLILYKAIVQTAIEDRKWHKGNNEAVEWRKLYIKIFNS